MDAKDALEHAIEFFDQRDLNAEDYWEFNKETRYEIAAALRSLTRPEAAGGDEAVVGRLRELGKDKRFDVYQQAYIDCAADAIAEKICAPQEQKG